MTYTVGAHWAETLKTKVNQLIGRAEGDVKQRLVNIRRSLTIVHNEITDDMAVRVAHEERLRDLEGRLNYYEQKLAEMEGH